MTTRSKAQPDKVSALKRPPDKLTPTPTLQEEPVQTDVLLQRALADPGLLSSQDVLQLQRALGNRSVSRLLAQPKARLSGPSALAIQPKLTVGPARDAYEREADRTAQQVVSQINAPPRQTPAAEQSVRRQPKRDDEEEAGPGPLAESVQRQPFPEEEEEIQRQSLAACSVSPQPPTAVEPQTNPQLQFQSRAGGADISAEVESSIQAARGSGQPLAENLQTSMDAAFDADFSAVRIHTDAQADTLNRSVQARAFTTGQDIFFRDGEYNPGSQAGQQLLAHELTHVVQQNNTVLRQKPAADSQPAMVQPGATAPQMIQRAKYAELSDSQKEMVDQVAETEFEKASQTFEQSIGLKAAQDKRALEIADELLERTVLLTETLFVNATDSKIKQLSAKGQEGLDEFYIQIFGIANRKDISGGVGKDLEMIREVFTGGSFREKMSLYYVALSENQTLNKILNQYSTLLDTEFKKYGGSDKEEDKSYLANLKEFQGLDDYVFRKKQKEFLKRAITWTQLEIQMERRNQLDLDKKPVKEQLTQEAAEQRKEQDERLAIRVINNVTGGQLEGDETTNPDKVQKIRQLVEAGMRFMKDGKLIVQDEKSEEGQKLIKRHQELTVYKQEQVGKALAEAEAKYKQGLGWFVFHMDRIFANEEPRLETAVLKIAADNDVEPDTLKAAMRRAAADKVFQDFGNPFDSKHKGVDFDAELLKALKTVTEESELKKLAKTVHQKTEKESKEGQDLETFIDKIAAKRFSMNFMGPSLFDAKKGVEASRVGDARKMNPEQEQTSDQTPADLEKTPFRLTYRELGNAFYKPEEFREKLNRFKQDKKITDESKWTKEAQEEFRQILYEENKSKKLPWKPGMKYWRIDIKSPLAETSKSLKVLVGAAVSGSTDRVLRGARYLGFKDRPEMDRLLLACLGWMLPARDHTYYEIMKAAEPYLDTAPQKNPFQDLVIDPDYALGHGYAKMTDYFPELKPTDYPDYFLSEKFKDTIAFDMKPEETDTTLRIVSAAEGKVVMTGDKVRYEIRNPQKEKVRFEWFWLRHESGNARAKAGPKEGSWDHAWNYKGLYKLYCLVYPSTGEHQDEPVATLRYDQIVFSKSSSETSDTDTINARAAFTTWHEELSDIPVKVKFESTGDLITCNLTVPAKLGEEPSVVYQGTSQQVAKLRGKSEVIKFYNEYYRAEKDMRELQAEACFRAAQAWEKGHKYDKTGSVNIDIFDSATEVVLKEHFFYVDREGEKEVTDEKSTVSGYRTQGGDFVSGIKSSVRLVNTRDGRLDISGDAMVWINFGDKARMVWWLNNRTDRSYTAFFRVHADYLKQVAKESVPESEANKEGNKGKPIISQDKATHQYAINRGEKSKSSATLEELQKQAVGHMVKMFQWKTFDLGSVEQQGEMPSGKGTLAHPFNEHLKKAKDLEIKLRFLKSAGQTPLEDIEKLEKERQTAERLGQEQWSKDYRFNLRKPGKGDISKDDRRQTSELTESDLQQQEGVFIAKLHGKLMPTLGKLLGQATGTINKANGDVKLLVAAADDLVHKAWEALKTDKLKELTDLPEGLQKRIYYLTVNGVIICQYLIGKIPELQREEVLKQVKFTSPWLEIDIAWDVLKDTKLGGKGKTQTPPSQSTSDTAKQTPTVVTPNDTSTKKGMDEPQKVEPKDPFQVVLVDNKFNQLVLSLNPQSFEKGVKGLARAKLTGVPNAGNTCYIASVMQLIASVPEYRAVFLTPPPHDMAERKKTLIKSGRLIISKIQLGLAISTEEILTFRTALIQNGWLGASEDGPASQQDAGELFRFIMSEAGATTGVVEKHDWSKPGQYDRTQTNRESMLQLGGLQPNGEGRDIVDLLRELFGQLNVEEERDGVPIFHRHQLLELPELLTLQLMRFNYSQISGQYVRLFEKIRVDEQLTIPSELTPDQKNHVYELVSFIAHLGYSPKGGHYIAYVKKSGQWYCANDANVTPVTEEVVARERQNAYLYNYRRLKRERPIAMPNPWSSSSRTEEDYYQKKLSQDPHYFWKILEIKIREAANDRERLNELMTVIGPGGRAQVRENLEGRSDPSEEEQLLKQTLLEIINTLDRQYFLESARRY